MEKPFYKALSIAGFDGSGGAGIQADIKTFSALGCYAASALTSLPVQNTMGVRSVFDIPTLCVEEQIRAILEDIPMDAVKIGVLHRHAIIESVGKILKKFKLKNIVIDPVMVAKRGEALLIADSIAAMQEHLFPMTTVLTPNLLEASVLLGREITKKHQMEQAGLDLLAMGPEAVVVKGGHLMGDCDDCLVIRGKEIEIHWFENPRIQSKNTHGTGCTFSSAVTAYLAHGNTILDAVRKAKIYLTQAIEAGVSIELGGGNGPVHHFYHLWNHLN